jgi:opacity protein-like surface antigen
MTKFNLVFIAGIAALGASSAAAQAADLMISAPPSIAPAYEAPAGGWDGPYIGVFGGFGSGDADHQPGPAFPGDPEGNDLDLSGALVGVDIGANFYLSDNVVGGIAGDIAWANISGSDDFGGFGEIEHTINWQGSVRGVLGIDAGAIMPYVTAGVAFANATRTAELNDESADATHVGWTAGVGVAIKATDNMAIDLQLRHSDFGSEVYDNAISSDPEIGLSSTTITAGIHFMM